MGVLRRDGTFHIGWCQLEAVEFVRIKPDAHRILATEQLDLPHTVETTDGFLNIGDHEVSEVIIPHLAIGRDEAGYHQEAAGGLLYPDPLLLNDLWQLAGGLLQLVLHLNLSDIRIGAGHKGQRNRDVTRGITLCRHVQQVVKTCHVLLNDLGDGVFYRLGRGSRVSRRNCDRGRGYRRVLGNR